MALALNYESIARQTGMYLGYDRDWANWNVTQVADMSDVLGKAMRSWYFPNLADGIYRWSFLRTSGYIQSVTNQLSYELPDDFLGLAYDRINFNGDSLHPPMVRRSEDMLLSLHASSYCSEVPQYYTIRSKGTGQDGRPQYELFVYPAPDDIYTFNFRYLFNPPELTAETPYPLGGAQHGETILAACLAAAEQKMEDTAALHTAAFTTLLAASIKLDQEMTR